MTIDHYQYLLVLLACLLLTAPLEVFGSGVYRQARRAAAALVPVAVVFVVWDVLAINGGVWSYNPRYMTGWHIGALPVEEMLFFLVIPLCGLLTYSAVSAILSWVSRRRADHDGQSMTGLGYTLPAVAAVLVVIGWELAVLRTGLFRRPAYWISMAIVVFFQVLVDGWLTKLSAPIVVYNEHHSSGIRFPWDIPVEDFLFGWAMVTAVLLLWERRRVRD